MHTSKPFNHPCCLVPNNMIAAILHQVCVCIIWHFQLAIPTWQHHVTACPFPPPPLLDFALSIHISEWCVHICLPICILYQSLIVVLERDAAGSLTHLLEGSLLSPSHVLLHQLFARKHLCDTHDLGIIWCVFLHTCLSCCIWLFNCTLHTYSKALRDKHPSLSPGNKGCAWECMIVCAGKHEACVWCTEVVE